MNTVTVNDLNVAGTTPASFTICLEPKVLKALLLFASDDESRAILRSIALDCTGAIPVLVATDGRRIGVYCLENLKSHLEHVQGKVLIIPRGLVESIKLGKKAAANCYAFVTFERDTVTLRLTQRGEDKAVTERALWGNYPKWRQVMPADPIKGYLQIGLNGHYLGDFSKAGEWLSGNDNGTALSVAVHGDGQYTGVISVRIATEPQFYGLLMPMRIEEAPSHDLPAFVR